MKEKVIKKFVDLRALKRYDERAEGRLLSRNYQSGEDVKATVGEVKNTLSSQTIQRNTTISANDSTVTITKTLGNMMDKTSDEEEIALPVASSTTAGVMNPATFLAVQYCSEIIDILLHGSVSIADLPENPTQQQLTEAWKVATSKDNPINNAKIEDSTNNKMWTYYENIGGWRDAELGKISVTLNAWTNELAGSILGSVKDGQLFAEPNGTGSVNGWDKVKEDIANNTADIERLEELLNEAKTAIIARYTKAEADDKFVAKTDLVAITDDEIAEIFSEDDSNTEENDSDGESNNTNDEEIV